MSSSRKKKDASSTSGEIRSTGTRKSTTKSHTVIRHTDGDSDTEQIHISDFGSGRGTVPPSWSCPLVVAKRDRHGARG